MTMRRVQKRRASLYELIDIMKTITAPTLVMTGDEDWPCLEPGILMKKNIATAALVAMPDAGHDFNPEDPAASHVQVQELFLAARGRHPSCVPRAAADIRLSILLHAGAMGRDDFAFLLLSVAFQVVRFL